MSKIDQYDSSAAGYHIYDNPQYDANLISSQLKRKRWVKLGDRLKRCKIHGSYFNPEIEPCWACYNEVENASS